MIPNTESVPKGTKYVDVESVRSQSKLFFDKLQALHIL